MRLETCSRLCSPSRTSALSFRLDASPSSHPRSLLCCGMCMLVMLQEGFAAGSIEGRVALKYFNPTSGQPAPPGQKHGCVVRSQHVFTVRRPRDDFSFKCHREEKYDKSSIAYPVHALSFHPVVTVRASVSHIPLTTSLHLHHVVEMGSLHSGRRMSEVG